MASIIPLTTSPNQTISIAPQVNGATLSLTLSLSWNRVGLFWAMDISDASRNLLVAGIPLLTGAWPAANILAPYDYMKIGSAYILNRSGATGSEANDSNLGTDFMLLWDDNPS